MLLQHVRCPECGVPMIERTGATGTFYGCSRFPLCCGSRPQGEGIDSYSKLLHTAYLKASRLLAGPRFIGYQDVQRWLLEKAFDREPTEDELENNEVTTMANEQLERAIDAACEYASEKSGETIDFLVYAHEDRTDALRGKLRFATTAEQIRNMPRPEIVRRYDTSDISQFEADVATHWEGEGTSCPRCGSWSAQQQQPVLQLGEATETISNLGLKPRDLASLFGSPEGSLEEPLTVRRTWDCGNCGLFTRIETKKGKEVSMKFEFDSDKKDGSVAGTSFKIPERKPR